MSKLLLDSCTFLWLNTDRSKIPARVLGLCSDERTDLYLSAVSVWEIAAKHSAGRLPLPAPLPEFIARCRAAIGAASLRLRETDAFHLPKLPPIHKDPFDRMLICQAIARGMAIVTPDPAIQQYPVLTIW